MPDSELTELLASYVPRLIQKRVAQNPVPINTPLAQDFLAVVMFADISGFTALTERLAEKGSAGVGEESFRRTVPNSVKKETSRYPGAARANHGPG